MCADGTTWPGSDRAEGLPPMKGSQREGAGWQGPSLLMRVGVGYMERGYCDGQSLASPGRWPVADRRYPEHADWTADSVVELKNSVIKSLSRAGWHLRLHHQFPLFSVAHEIRMSDFACQGCPYSFVRNEDGAWPNKRPTDVPS